MYWLYILILVTLGFSSSHKECSIDGIERVGGKKLKFSFSNGTDQEGCDEIKYKIRNEDDNRYININNEKVYLSVDKKGEPEIDFCSLFKAEFIDSPELHTHNPIVGGVLIIDDNGEVIDVGLYKKDIEQYYNEYTRKILAKIKNRKIFNPAQVGCKPVSYIYTFLVLYSNLTCKVIELK